DAALQSRWDALVSASRTGAGTPTPPLPANKAAGIFTALLAKLRGNRNAMLAAGCMAAAVTGGARAGVGPILTFSGNPGRSADVSSVAGSVAVHEESIYCDQSRAAQHHTSHGSGAIRRARGAGRMWIFGTNGVRGGDI